MYVKVRFALRYIYGMLMSSMTTRGIEKTLYCIDLVVLALSSMPVAKYNKLKLYAVFFISDYECALALYYRLAHFSRLTAITLQCVVL